MKIGGLKINGNFCAIAWLITFGLTVALIVWWKVFDHPYFYRQIDAHVVSDGPIYPGDTIFIQRTYCVHVRRSTIVTRLIDHTVVPLPDKTFVNVTVSCKHPMSVRFPLKIPNYIEPGIIYFHGSHEVWQNPLRTDSFSYPDIKIIVSPKPKKHE